MHRPESNNDRRGEQAFENYLKQFKPSPPRLSQDSPVVNPDLKLIARPPHANRYRMVTAIAASWIAGLIMGGAAVIAARQANEPTVVVIDSASEPGIEHNTPGVISESASRPPAPPKYAGPTAGASYPLFSPLLDPLRITNEQSSLTMRGYVPRSDVPARFVTQTSNFNNQDTDKNPPASSGKKRNDLMRELLFDLTI